jgi:hypothetical protein
MPAVPTGGEQAANALQPESTSGRATTANAKVGNTMTDTEDDVFISQSIESVSGPHPEAESGFTLFCEVVVPALT